MRNRRLPGIGFVAAPPAPPEALPRMDIAVFAGFARTGPIHLPVAVESVAEYASVFGPDAPLAWDAAKAQAACAHLGPSVRAFFSNGGRRCWVIRIARDAALARERVALGLEPPGAGAPVAAASRFALPGVLAAWREGGRLKVEPAFASARCEGSWSDDLVVETALQRRAIAATALRANADATFAFDTTDAIGAGDVLELGDSGRTVYARVSDVREAGDRREVTIDRTVEHSPAVAELDTGAAGWSPASVAILQMDVRVRRAADAGVIARGQGLARAHPRAWLAGVTDHDYYASAAGIAAVERFPLAGAVALAGRDAAGIPDDLWLVPPGVGADFGSPSPALKGPGSALERDGLSAFDPALFLDPALEAWVAGEALITATLDELVQAADYVRYEQAVPRRLLGIHAALGFDAGIADEATLVCVPDAVHCGWERAAPFVAPEDSPTPETTVADECTFHACYTATLDAPHFLADSPPRRDVLEWSEVAGATEYRLEQAADAGFADAIAIYDGAQRRIELPPSTATLHYRVNAKAGDVASSWSAPETIAGAARVDWQVRDEAGFDADGRGQALVDLQAALMRMCAAKGELLAVLSMPAHFRERDAIAHAARLQPSRGETSPATYGALYHPWPVDRRDDGTYFAFPPDGPVMGVLAARAFERGAWIAPANEPMKDFVALAPALRLEWMHALLDAQVNVVRRDPRGFLLMSEDTLAIDADADLRPINVRRLLVLLRRLALQRGATYVFEPHDDTLRRTVHRAFQQSLGDLFMRGAFAGATPEQSFQVVTGETINTPGETDLGRFHVDLKVAAALPMTFLTVRLRQVGERLTASEGR